MATTTRTVVAIDEDLGRALRAYLDTEAAAAGLRAAADGRLAGLLRAAERRLARLDARLAELNDEFAAANGW